MNQSTACVLVLVAGTLSAMGDDLPMTVSPSVGTVHNTAHIYFNAVTGERTVTLIEDQVAGADSFTGSPRVWSSYVSDPCIKQGYTTTYYFAVSNPELTSHGAIDPYSTAITQLDYGDLPTDTVVDCIEINWTTSHPDIDLDEDGMGDGVEELAGQWIVWDLDNGRSPTFCDRWPLVDIFLYNLPGNTLGPGNLSAYMMDVDLAGYGSATDLSFEICDTDGDCQEAAFCYSMIDYDSDGVPDGPIGLPDRNFDGMPDSDLDGDGLADWSWTVRFYQPGIGNDFDSDSDTGIAPPMSSDTIGIRFGYPEGDAIDNGDGTWAWEFDTNALAPGTGAEDRYAQYTPPNATGDSFYEGGYWFGGFACEGGFLDDGGDGYTPAAMFQFAMYGPSGNSGCNLCPVDLNCDQQLNFFDISEFIVRYQAGEDYNGDGTTDFFDVSQFIQDYMAGCP